MIPKTKELFIFCILIQVYLLSLGRDISFSNLSVENGLSNNEVNTIFKDSYGFMWFGTLHGLDRFDGVEIRPYASKFPDQIENVYAIAEDYKRRLWVGTSQGLFKQEICSGHFNLIPIDTVPVSVTGIVQMPDSSLYLGTNQGLYIFNSITNVAQHIVFNSHEKGKTNYITGLWADNHNNCWLSTHHGLIRFSVKEKEYDCFLFETEQKEANNTFTAICNIGNKIYLGTSYSGIIEFDLFSKTFEKSIDTGNKLILTIHDDNKERIFVGTNGGGLKIVNIRTEEVKTIAKEENNPKSISSNSIYSFYLDEYERLWIGTYSGGVNYSGMTLGNFNLHPVTTQYPEVNESIRSFYFSPDGNNYFGTRNGFISLNKKKEVNVYHAATGKESLRSNIVLSVFPYKNDILLGTYGGGISRFSQKEQSIKEFLGQEISRQGNTYDFETDKEGNLWIASFNGIYKYSPNGKTLINYNKENCGLIDDRIFDIKIDSKERLWIGTISGTSLFNIVGDTLKKLELPGSFLNNYKTNYIYEDQAGNIWVCTEVGGLYLLESDLSTSKNYRDSNGLPDNSTCAIIESSAGVYWISSLKGFSKFTLQNEEFTNFSVSDGLPGLVFTPAATHISNDGRIWFGNEKGLVWFYPDEIVKRTINSNIIITDLYVSGRVVKQEESDVLNKPVEITKEIELKHSVSSIGFRFVDLNYLNPFDNNYFYKLEGVDKDWQENGSNQTVFYNNLKPGEYIFKVINKNDPSITPTNITELKVRITKPVYKSPVSIVIFILVGLVSVFFASKYITKLLRIKSKYVQEHQDFEKYKGSNLTDAEREQIIRKLSTYMKNKKPYLNPELKLTDIANDINIPIHNISQSINQSLGQSFSDFVNNYRVEEVKELMKKDTTQKFTLIAIATQCGFNSKTSFYRVFKKVAGKTPAEYFNEIRR